MPIFTFIARVSDGMFLVASSEYGAYEGSKELDTYKFQAKTILRKLDHSSPSRLRIASGPYQFLYIIEDGICYLTLADKNYPQQLALNFLEEIKRGFVADLKKDFNDGWKQRIAIVARPYAFIRFDKFIQKKRKDYVDPSSKKNVQKLNAELREIQDVMKKSINEVLNRQKELDNASNISEELVGRTKQYEFGTKKLNTMMMLKKFAPALVILLVIIFLIYFKFLY
eukprot:TRINITY_DN774261_c0_g1_i1.p1 TRINITY_DN774261_c0_g1~~TRINITY_DN774261_c0_g1_i1.p1  ORF type:complete len:226 (-),score=49.21 TRINITY_DN774261_c0_g1_i1:227-904(-)